MKIKELTFPPITQESVIFSIFSERKEVTKTSIQEWIDSSEQTIADDFSKIPYMSKHNREAIKEQIRKRIKVAKRLLIIVNQ